MFDLPAVKVQFTQNSALIRTTVPAVRAGYKYTHATRSNRHCKGWSDAGGVTSRICWCELRSIIISNDIRDV